MPGQSGQLKPRRVLFEERRDARGEQCDQRHDDHRVGHEVAHVHQVTAGEQRSGLRRPASLEHKDECDEAKNHGSRIGNLAGVNRVDSTGRSESVPPIPGEQRRDCRCRHRRQVDRREGRPWAWVRLGDVQHGH